ncbi:hypothetical protein BDZ91DRAFT_801459 [Kalaharituber pfeilii]|nr:hypothetical protein BDZ91DRAFT_801459 [Kalaharituber pfeilii]
MPRKHYSQHLAEVIKTSPDRSVEAIKRGEDDGSFVISYRPPEGSGILGLIDITAMIPDLSEYPAQHQTYLYTSSSDIPSYITSSLESLLKDGVPISQLIQNLATTLSRVILQRAGNKKMTNAQTSTVDPDEMMIIDDDYDYDDGDGDEELESDGGSVAMWSEDEATKSDPEDNGESQIDGALGLNNVPEVLPKLRRDLRAVKAAGFRIGILGDIRGGVNGYISVSIRISKLDLSDEALNAWKLDKKKYLILLMHYSNYYKDLSDLIQHSYIGKQSIQYCIGTSRRYKPTLGEAIRSFSTVLPTSSDGGSDEEAIRGPGDGFRGIFISRPLNELLHSKLIDLVKLRVERKFSWEEAERFLTEWQGKLAPTTVTATYRQPESTPMNLPSIATQDSLREPNRPAAVSFPLVAMQFTLRHLVRCTEFCLVCHNKIQSDFEALKPYVCSNPLCLYQYMSLGFGPSIEYEITSQPSVVDLLISFCYTSAKTAGLTDFPTGMNLMVPWRDDLGQLTNHPALLQYSKTPHVLQFSDSSSIGLKRGDWIRIQKDQELRYYRVEDVTNFPIVTLSGVITGTAETGATLDEQSGTDEEHTEPVPVICTRFATNFDSLNHAGKQTAICEMLDTLPTVHQMKKWLEDNTTVGSLASLRNWVERISPAACGVLRWIIASNRSCIIPVDEVHEDGSVSEIPREPRVWGMGSEYIQFRFAMGAPDKEQRFVTAVKDAQRHLNLRYPTLFAFHGSPLSNWHSIIREGLHFNKTANGRAFGHGCYHSLALGTSQYYCKSPSMSGIADDYIWRNSCIKVTAAICLNEIVNAPSEFVSSNPHLVVNNLDWIQTRYLFVSKKVTVPVGNPTLVDGVVAATPTTRRIEEKLSSSVFEQDPAMTPTNLSGQKLVIPAAVSYHITGKRMEPHAPTVCIPAPSSTSSIFSLVRKPKGTKKLGTKTDPIVLDNSDSDVSVRTEQEDQMVLMSEDEVEVLSQNITVGNNSGNKLLSKAASLFGRASKGFQKSLPSVPVTDFVPGSLDMTGITLIPPPSYASSTATRRLQAELKAMLKTQETHPLHELGWYINPELVSNVYQWVFEFHSFDEKLPLAMDMKEKKISSIVLEARFGSSFPMSPPFIRVIKPRFLGFNQGGGGHVTLGGALCLELLTNSGWSAVSSLESVLLQVRMAITSTDPKPARLLPGPIQAYGAAEAKEAYLRACRMHGWQVPTDFADIL